MTIVHIRRCHVCGNTNESENSVNLRCQSCGKPMAPFYYFDESKLDGLLEMGPYFSLLKAAPDYNPLYGLSIYWEESIYENQLAGHSKSTTTHSGLYTKNRSG